MHRHTTTGWLLGIATVLWSTLTTVPVIVQGGTLETAIAADASVKIADVVRQAIDKLSSYPAETAVTSEAYDPSHLSNDLVHINASGQIELLFHAKAPIGETEEQDLERLGAKIVTKLELPARLQFPPAYMVQAWVPYDQVEAAAALPWVVAITPPDYGHVNPHPTNPINSEGVGLHNADQAQNRGVNGAGVTVGVISNGVSNLAASQARNELPAVNVLAAGTGDEGTAMLEIVHDMAPGAALLFQATGNGVVNHVNALNNLVTNGANVITEDLAFDAEPAFQQGIAAATKEAIATADVSVYSSAGNRGDDHAARVQAVGTGGGPDGVNFAAAPPGCAFNPDNVVAIAPGGDTTFDVTLGGNTSITLQWSEPRAIFPTAGQGGFTDLNLYVMDAALTQCLAQSVAVQANGQGDTIEQISINMPDTAAKIVVDVQGTSTAVAAPLLDLRWRNMQAETDATTRAGSLDPNNNLTGLATTVAAVNGNTGVIEGFSSGGPVQLGLTTVCPGNAAGSCTGIAGPGITTTNGRPNWAAADGVSVSGVGSFGSGTCPAVNPGDCRFFGTSASAPHAAGCDALVRDGIGVPASAVAPVINRLASTATDIAPAGVDNITGAGQLNCFAAVGFPTALCQNVTVPTAPGLCTANASINAGSFDPNNDPIALTQAPPGPYGLGNTPVTLTVTETGPGALSSSCQAIVTVVDQEPPVLSNRPAPIQVEQTNLAGTPVTVSLPTATDNCDASVTITSNAPAVFPLGTTIVTFTATDDAGNSSSATTTVTVVDTTPPTINSVTANPSTLWPPNHKLRPVTVSVNVTDICDAAPKCKIISVSSNEPVNGLGDGDTAPDWIVTGDLTVNLRAERSGTGNGRVYTTTVRCTDNSGNSATSTATVTVPHDQRR